MQENEILTSVIKEFMKATDYDCDKAEKAVANFADFYEFIENNENLKQEMYGFFYKMLDSYVTFRFYDTPVPALTTNETYMADYKSATLEKARTFFNFGGIEGVN